MGCQYCGLPYNWRKSGSRFLKMTYCSLSCEKASLGFSMEALLAAPRIYPNEPWMESLADYLLAEAVK